MIFYLIATVLTFLGCIFWIIDTIGGAIQTKGYCMLCFITSALVIMLKFCYENPETIKEFFR
ncbi:hypothetical protein LCGC14_2220350 [marine sediment metagenome]|uniref:Uncharacterized protein n=1 Tax=marine sediment metagenome TaxID=412755 RepID=A0A0F9FNQ9_9ZZZZ